MNLFAKRNADLRCWLLGAGYHLAFDAMRFASEYHVGLRKDRVTPEFDHQVSIATYLLPWVSYLRNPETVLAVVFLHDVREDYNVPDAVIRARFGASVAGPVDAVTKEFDGVRRSEDAVRRAIAACPIASVVKLADRIHNQSTMRGVFSESKQSAYAEETRRWILPMLAEARTRFPDQEPVYANAEKILLEQLTFVHDLVAA
jgi:(p)ppGpp synthase/HD superfamily hydrolase